MSTEMLHQYEVLIKKAVADIEIAKLAIAAHDDAIDDATILFHLQQAAEKLLKALLAFKDIHFEKVHDLLVLVQTCEENGIPLPEFTTRFSLLNPFAVVGRYDILEAGTIDVTIWIATLYEFKAHVLKYMCPVNEKNLHE